MPSQGSNPRPILPEDKNDQLDPNWSPDGSRIVFSSGVISWTGGGDPKGELRILDLASHQVSSLPGSKGMYSPRWSHNGRFIAALDSLSINLKIFDFQTQQWSVVAKGQAGHPTWSRDGKFIYFLRTRNGPGVYRIRISGGDAERVVVLTGFRNTGDLLSWMSLDPADTPMLLRDTGTDDIYALTLEQK